MEGFGFPVEVVRSGRKRSVCIQLAGDGVRVRVPHRLSDGRVRELIGRRMGWITAKLRERAARPAPKPREYVSGEAFAYLGRNYRLRLAEGGRASVQMRGGQLLATLPAAERHPQRMRALLEAWYLERARVRLDEKTRRLAAMVGRTPASVSVRDYRARWGSCSIRGDISYNWRIIMAPHRIVDYVVVHELCHLLEHNHSPEYWRHVARHIPDWKDRRDWLRHNPLIF